MANNNNNPVDILLNSCRQIQAETGLYIGTFLSDLENNNSNNSDNIVNIDCKFAFAIDRYNTTIEIIEGIIERDSTQFIQLSEYLNYSIGVRNHLIYTKAKMLEKEINNNNNSKSNEDVEHQALFTLNVVNLYSWKDDSTNNNNNNNSGEKEKENIGDGKLYLLKALDCLHIIDIYLNDGGVSDDHSIDIDDATSRPKKDEKEKHADYRFLITRETPVFSISQGSYIILSNDRFYGIQLPQDIPSVYISIFESLLAKICCFGVLQPVAGPDLQGEAVQGQVIEVQKTEQFIQSGFVVNSIKYMSAGLESGSQSLASSIESASTIISLGLRGTGFYIKSNLEKNKEPVQVSPFVSTSIGYIKSTTPYAAQYSSQLIESVSDAVGAVGNGIVSGFRTIIPVSKAAESDNETLSAVGELGKSSIKAIVSISDALTNGISQIAGEMSGTTVDVVNHKLGHHVANVTNDTFSISKDVINTAMNLQIGSAKRVAIKVITNGGGKVAEKQFNIKEGEEQLKLEGDQEQEQEQEADRERELVRLEKHIDN